MIYASFYKIHELNITFCSMYTVQVGSWSEHHPTLWRVTDTYFYSAPLRTGQIHGFQNLTYSSGKTPDPFQKRRLSPLPEPCLDKFCISSHFTACWVCLSSVSLGHCAWKAHSIPKFLHSLFSLKPWPPGRWPKLLRSCPCAKADVKIRLWQLGID